MTDTKEPLDVASVIGSRAYACAARYPGLVEQADLEQVAWLWVLEHPQEVAERTGLEESGLGAYRLGQDVWKVMERYARKEKAAKSGYASDDELFYSDAVIDVVLPAVLRGDMTPPSRAGDTERVANTSDPAEGGVWLASYLDVKTAWDEADLTGKQRDLLVAYYRDEYSQSELATMLGILQPAVAKRLKQARGKLIKKLGGYDPRAQQRPAPARPGVKRVGDGAVAAMR